MARDLGSAADMFVGLDRGGVGELGLGLVEVAGGGDDVGEAALDDRGGRGASA